MLFKENKPLNKKPLPVPNLTATSVKEVKLFMLEKPEGKCVQKVHQNWQC